MTEIANEKKASRLVVWLLAIVVGLVIFYLLDHAVMGMQGLPLNWDLTPAQ